MSNQKVPLKDILFNRVKIEQVASEIHNVYPSLRTREFTREVVVKFPELELKSRISWVAQCLKKYLPSDYSIAIDVLIQALPAPNNPQLSDGDFGDFIYATYADYVAKYGCEKEYVQLSLNALHKITQRFSAEDAIRYFLNAYPKETLRELSKWTGDSHYHVRRLCSEGTRPKLPWSKKINIPVSSSLSILDRLYYDRTRFVTRSVANHLNDISKTSPDIVLDALKKWQKSGRQAPEEMDYIMRHALRTLTKQGDSRAMLLLGYSQTTPIKVSCFVVPKMVKMNDTLEFSFTIVANDDTNIIVDYILYFQNKLRKLNTRKVFKLKRVTLKKNQPVTISKRHLLQQFRTTRTLYAGSHEIQLQINGKSYGKHTFELI